MNLWLSLYALAWPPRTTSDCALQCCRRANGQAGLLVSNGIGDIVVYGLLVHHCCHLTKMAEGVYEY
jgi:hypothetical protein